MEVSNIRPGDKIQLSSIKPLDLNMILMRKKANLPTIESWFGVRIKSSGRDGGVAEVA